jgi:hypothetical protein
MAESVAEKLTTRGPLSATVGVHENTLETGLPVVGRPGVMLAPTGRPATLRVTVWPKSVADACTVKLTGLPSGLLIWRLLPAAAERRQHDWMKAVTGADDA